MSITGLIFKVISSRSDKKRDSAIPLPQGVTECRNISYGPHGKESQLDVYYPQGTDSPLPTIVSIHGGGYVYGSKEIYRRYGMDMARRGFAFVNFNYRLAPKWKFPAPLSDTNAVLEWVSQNHHRYHLDPQRILLIGDSAGAQLASQYAAIHTNPQYAALFGMKKPNVTIRALGLFCGMYDPAAFCSGSFKALARDYLGAKFDLSDPRLKVLDAITSAYPPTFLATAHHDFLKDNAEPMFNLLTAKGIPAQLRCYGTQEDKAVAHVFHVNILLPDAIKCNDQAAEFFKKHA